MLDWFARESTKLDMGSRMTIVGRRRQRAVDKAAGIQLIKTLSETVNALALAFLLSLYLTVSHENWQSKMRATEK